MVAPSKFQRPVLTKLAAAIKAVNTAASAKPANALLTKPQPSKWLSKPASFAISAAKAAVPPSVTGHGMPGANVILSMPKATQDALDAIEPGFAGRLMARTAEYLTKFGDPPEHRTLTAEHKAAVVKMLTKTDDAKVQQIAKAYTAFSQRFTDLENVVRYCLDIPDLAPQARALQTMYRTGAPVTQADLKSLMAEISTKAPDKMKANAWVTALRQVHDRI